MAAAVVSREVGTTQTPQEPKTISICGRQLDGNRCQEMCTHIKDTALTAKLSPYHQSHLLDLKTNFE